MAAEKINEPPINHDHNHRHPLLRLGVFGFGCVGQGLYHVLHETQGVKAEIKKICVKTKNKQRPLAEDIFTFNKEDILRSTENAKIGTGFSEMGSTASVLANILRLVPEKDPYRYGESYFKAIKVAIPNIGLSQKGSERLMALQGASATSDAVLDLIPSEWITYRLDPIRFAAGEGVGFSGIGEPYINFGLTGVVIYFILYTDATSFHSFVCGRWYCQNEALFYHPRFCNWKVYQ